MKRNWMMPEKYKEMDIRKYILDHDNGHNKEGYVLSYELVEFEARGLLDMLRYMVYPVDVMRENNIVWGVGRGSGVASYVLYPIGINRINQ